VRHAVVKTREGFWIRGGNDGTGTRARTLPALLTAALVDVDELPGNGLIMPCGGVGAPLVGLEKIEAGDEEKRLRDLMERHTGRTVAALTAGEIGGGNRQARHPGGSHGPGSSSHQRR
jgi:DUF917 family protein